MPSAIFSTKGRLTTRWRSGSTIEVWPSSQRLGTRCHAVARGEPGASGACPGDYRARSEYPGQPGSRTAGRPRGQTEPLGVPAHGGAGASDRRNGIPGERSRDVLVGVSRLKKDQITERGAWMARRDEREYREYLSEEQRRQPRCP